MSYYKFNENPDKENPHYCFGEELLVPWTENSDTQRLNMWSSHINQTVHLKAPEYPKVFTNFEDQFGEYSVAYKEAPEEFKIIKRIYKNEFNYVTIIQYTKSKVFDLIWNHSANRITEDYGYKLNDCIKEKPEGSIVHQGEQVYKSDNYDADGNFMYGVNLKAVYLPYKGMTYEDGIVISKSAAAKMTSYKVEETSFSVNNNDVLINIYGDENVYKSFPHVGDDIHKKVLVAIRRRASMSQIYSFQSAQLRKIDFFTDSIIYTGGGKVTDIEIYSNKSLEEFRKMKSKAEDEHRELDSFTKEIIELLEQQQSFYAELAEELEKIIPAVYYNKAEAEKLYLEEDKKIDKSVSRIASRNIDRNFSQVAHALPAEDNPNRYTDNIAYWWKISHENINDNIAWRDDGNTFANFKMKFTILKENPLTAGCKLSGRYGNKGVVTLIEDDDKMPITVDGIRADVCLNPLGIINRMNLSQIKEQYLNSIGRKAVKHLVQLNAEDNNLEKMQDFFFNLMRVINYKESEFLYLEYITLNKDGKQKFFDNIIRDGIYFHQTPFFGNMGLDDFVKLFKDYPELASQDKFVGIEKPLTIGEIYFIRLKHESGNKFSARSTGLANPKYLPTKSSLKKDKRILFQNTPIRLGEMELTNLLSSKRGDIVMKLVRTYASGDSDRLQLNDLAIKAPDPFNIDVNLDTTESGTSRKILDKYLSLLDIQLEGPNDD